MLALDRESSLRHRDPVVCTTGRGAGFTWVEASRCLLEEGAPKSALEGGRPVGEGLLGLAGKLLTLQGAGPGGRKACPEGPVVTL